jgi:hypothetical protein
MHTYCILLVCAISAFADFADFMHTTYPVQKNTSAISRHIVRKSRCAVSLHPVCVLRVLTKCLHSLHKVCIYFHKLITKCALSVPDADFADLVQTLQTWCNKTPVQPVLARPPCEHHRPDCTQTLQTSRPCPKSPDFKRTLSQPPVSLCHGVAKMTVAKNTAESSALVRLPIQDHAFKCA